MPQCLSGKLAFASECNWVEATGEAVVENITPDEARQLAINRARISAIESKTGVRVHGGTLVKDYQLLADMVQTLSQGYIIEEKVIKWEQGVEGLSIPLTTYKVQLSACVAGVGEKDPYFKVDAKLNKPVFIEGEEATITVKTSRDAYLHIFNLTADDRISPIAPSVTLPIIPIKANKEFKFPPEGFGLLMSVIKDKKRSSECFIIVATKEPYDFIGFAKTSSSPPLEGGDKGVVRAESMTVPEFYRNIIKIPSNAKAEEMLVYEVVAK
ncbi:MAG: DUF4384 domain-containing protein [Nitrospinae bacterium]|nr:DUF4384 domain-containing protein [Nitrospinota bacterium]